MKKILSLLCGSLIVLLMFAAPGNPVKANEVETNTLETSDDHCGCPVTPILGAEKNKIVSDLLKGDGFKNKKMELIQGGYTWNGVNEINVIKFDELPVVLVAVPFITEDGSVEMFIFHEGVFLYNVPSEDF